MESTDRGPIIASRRLGLAERRVLWLLICAHLALAVGVIAWTPKLDRPFAEIVHPKTPPSPDPALSLAGSGTNLPITRALVSAYLSTPSAVPIRVHTSIGSGGGIRAARAGAIVMGLVSRGLSAEESAGLSVRTYARVPVVFAVDPAVPVRSLSPAALLRIYAGRQTHWSNGLPIRVLLREPGDSGQAAIAADLRGFDAALRAARDRNAPVLFTDRAMQEALLTLPGAIGVFDLSAIEGQNLPLMALSVNGVAPSPDAIADGRYPYSKPLSFVWPAGPPPVKIRPFLDFIDGPGAALIRAQGALPVLTRP